MELWFETYELLPPVATGDPPVVTGGLRWVSSTGSLKEMLKIPKKTFRLKNVFFWTLKHKKNEWGLFGEKSFSEKVAQPTNPNVDPLTRRFANKKNT